MTPKHLPKQAILIVNAKSRQGAESFDRCVELLEAAGIDLIDSRAIKKPDTMGKEVQDAIRKAPMVILGGGDGTLSSNIDHFKGEDTVFALLPLGTANSFARALDIPLELEGAVEVIASGKRQQIDLGCINGEYFGNSAAIGLSPLIARTIPPGFKKMLGRVGYAAWAARMGITFQPFRLTVRDESSVTTVWASEVRIANGGFFGGVELVEDAELDSGEIIIQIVTGKTSHNIAKSWFSNMLRLRDRDKWQAEIRAKKVVIETDPVMDVAIDGELSTQTPITVHIAPKSVAIAVPKSKPKAKDD